jgi:hypothetical protein
MSDFSPGFAGRISAAEHVLARAFGDGAGFAGAGHDLVGPERVVASTDCGFGTFANYGKIDPAITWMKLAALREGANLAAVSLAGA